MPLASKRHTAGDSRWWTVKYDRCLKNGAKIDTMDITSNSTSCTVSDTEILGPDVRFRLNGGTVGERVTVSLEMNDDAGNVKNDTIIFTVISP